MGCDIHSVAQVKQNGKWITVLKHIAGDPRDYNTFGILANVRNSNVNKSFYETFLKPRGLPSDFLIEENSHHIINKKLKSGEDYLWTTPDQALYYQQQADKEESIYMGEHSFQVYTAKEINVYSKATKNIKEYFIGYFQSQNIDLILSKNDDPSYYTEELEESYQILNLDEYIILKDKNQLPSQKFLVKYEWLSSFIDNSYILKINEQLQGIVNEYNVSEDDVRFVFGFDS